MSWLKDNKIFIVLIYINLMVILKLIKTCYLITDFSYIYITGVYFASVIFYWVYHGLLKKSVYKAIFIMCIFIGLLYLYFAKLDFMKDLLLNRIPSDFETINTSIYNGEPISFNTFKLILTIIMPVIIITVMAFTTWGLYNSVIVFTLTFIMFLWYTDYVAEIKNNLFLVTFLTLITYCVNIYKKNTKKLAKKGYKTTPDITRIVAYGIILCIIIAMISNIMPQSFEGKYVSDLRSRFQNKFIRNNGTNEEQAIKLKYSISSSGYDGGGGKLGGPITLNRLIAFYVNSDKPYYLRGNVNDYYDGFTWKHTDEKNTRKDNSEQDVFKDRFSYDYLDTNNKTKITIYPSTIYSTTLFTPLYATNIALDNSEIYYDENSTFVNGEIFKSPYDVEFYNVSPFGQTILDRNKSSNRTIGVPFYQERYKKYLQLPDNISPATYELVYNLTKDCKNELEKVDKIQKYLNTTFPYTLKVSQVPDGHEFVDYFLFTEKKGYCVYFATAATIMCRIAGIPARYVEGYLMSSEKDSDGRYIVREESAHAWTEVLYMQNQNSGLWQTLDAVPNATEILHEEQKKEEEGSTNPNSSNNNPNKNKQPKVPGVDEEGGSPASINSSNKLSTRMLVFIYAVSALLAIMFIRIVMSLMKKYRLLKTGSIIPLYVYSMKRLESIKIKKEPSVTDMEFVEKISDRVLKERMIVLAEAAYEEYYGGKDIKLFDKKGYYRFIEKYIRRSQNIFVYFIKRIFYINLFFSTRNFINSKIK